MRKKILKAKPNDNNKVGRLKKIYSFRSRVWVWWYDSWYTDKFSEESSGLSSEQEESIENLTSLTEIFQIIPS